MNMFLNVLQCVLSDYKSDTHHEQSMTYDRLERKKKLALYNRQWVNIPNKHRDLANKLNI